MTGPTTRWPGHRRWLRSTLVLAALARLARCSSTAIVPVAARARCRICMSAAAGLPGPAPSADAEASTRCVAAPASADSSAEASCTGQDDTWYTAH